ncbi:MAG: SLBB domain-containing protein [Planctomycetota bacterium]|nr:SLBB domain-containing protein [Planctomycetota bacterium]
MKDLPWKITTDIVGFIVLQLIALALSIRLWRRPIGKVTAAASGALAAGAIVFGSFVCFAPRAVPLCPIEGLVTDAVTRKPIAGAHVFDHVYGGHRTRPIKEAWSDSEGHYLLQTWFEDQTLSACASGYETGLKLFPGEGPCFINFELHPTTAPTSQPSDSEAVKDMALRFLTTMPEDAAQAQAPGSVPPGPEDMQPLPPEKDYRIGLEDVLDIILRNLFGDGRESACRRAVSTAGEISLPELVKPIVAAGKTEEELKQDIVAAYKASKGRDLTVSVTVTRTGLHRVSVVGCVRVPGWYPIKPGMRLAETVSAAGGVKDEGVRTIYVVRQPPGNWPPKGAARFGRGPGPTPGPRTLAVDFRELTTGAPGTNIAMWPGDCVIVRGLPAREFYVFGEVDRPGVYPLKGREISVKMALDAAGVRTNPAPQAILYRRTQGGTKEVMMPVHIDAIFTGREPDLILQPDDILAVGSAQNRPASQPAEGLEFGPVMERTVNHTGEGCLIDLDSGRVTTLPAEVAKEGQTAAMAWMVANGIDAGGLVSTNSRGLFGFDLVAIPSPRSWEGISIQSLVEAVSQSKGGNPVFLTDTANLPATYIIKTREGGTGLLQIVGFSENPKATRIRYKLLQASRPETPTTRPASSGAAKALEFRMAPFAPHSAFAQANPKHELVVSAEELAGYLKLLNEVPPAKWAALQDKYTWFPIRQGEPVGGLVVAKGPADALYVLLSAQMGQMIRADWPWQVTAARRGADAFNRPCVDFTLDAAGATWMSDLTGRYANPKVPGGAHMAILVDGQVCSAPRIMSPIARQGQITGRFTDKEVDDLVRRLTARPAEGAKTSARKEAESLAAEGWRLWGLRKLPEAEGTFRAAVEKDPGNANAWNGLGWAQMNQGKPLEAGESFRKATTIDPRLAGAWNGLGWIAKAQGRSDEAIEHWQKAVGAQPTATAALAGLAGAYAERGQHDQAAAACRQWLAAEPGNAEAKAALARAEQAAKATPPEPPTTQPVSSGAAKTEAEKAAAEVAGKFLAAMRTGQVEQAKACCLGARAGWQEDMGKYEEAPIGTCRPLLERFSKALVDYSRLAKGSGNEIRGAYVQGDEAVVIATEFPPGGRYVVVTLRQTGGQWLVYDADDSPACVKMTAADGRGSSAPWPARTAISRMQVRDLIPAAVLDLDTGMVNAVGDDISSPVAGTAWDIGLGPASGKIVCNQRAYVCLLPLPEAKDFADAAGRAARRFDELVASRVFRLDDEAVRFFAVLTEWEGPTDHRLAVVEILSRQDGRITLAWTHRPLPPDARVPTTRPADKESVVASDGQVVNNQIELYRMQHGQKSPGTNELGPFDGQLFVDQLTLPVDAAGKVSRTGPAAGFPHGPYIRDFPANPFIEDKSLAARVLGGPGPSPNDGSSGWWFDTKANRIQTNHKPPPPATRPGEKPK